MRCHICDSNLASPKFNRDLDAWEPCQACLDAISDTLSEFKDNAVFYEEDIEVALHEAEIPTNFEQSYDFT